MPLNDEEDDPSNTHLPHPQRLVVVTMEVVVLAATRRNRPLTLFPNPTPTRTPMLLDPSLPFAGGVRTQFTLMAC